jgi:hypothetical protein
MSNNHFQFARVMSSNHHLFETIGLSLFFLWGKFRFQTWWNLQVFFIFPFHYDPSFLTQKYRLFAQISFSFILYCRICFTSNFETKELMHQAFYLISCYVSTHVVQVSFHIALHFNVFFASFYSHCFMFHTILCKFLFVSSYVSKLVFYVSAQVFISFRKAL